MYLVQQYELGQSEAPIFTRFIQFRHITVLLLAGCGGTLTKSSPYLKWLCHWVPPASRGTVHIVGPLAACYVLGTR